MQTCGRCLLSDTIPSVKIDSEGLCNFCSDHAFTEPCTADEEEQFTALLHEHRHKRYQAVLAYSGGKDSTFTLKLLKEKYDLSILALTFDNGFLSDTCFKNIQTVTDALGVESVIVKYPASKMIKAFKCIEDGKAFPRQSLERASAICNLCIMFIKNLIYYEAIIRDIPIICFGWTPGQIRTNKPLIKLNHTMLLKGFNNIKTVITGQLGADYERYFLDEKFMKDNENRMPYLYYPFVNNNYNEEHLLAEIKKLGWNPPDNTDGNSSNCLLNSYANQSHLAHFGYHPYAFEISNLVREGYLTREEGIRKLGNATNPASYQMICDRFNAVG